MTPFPECESRRTVTAAALLSSLWLATALPTAAHAWGDKGHTMTARVAARALPKEMPAFFRKAEKELGYLCPEPDRWRNEKREPALKAYSDRDHIFKLEDLVGELPANRYDYILQYVGKPRADGKGPTAWKDLGFAPYAVAEAFEKMTVNFMLWRQSPDKTPLEKQQKRQIEQNIIYTAGVVGHFITDLAMPLHTTIHGDGWLARIPNPKGFTPQGKGVHVRFENKFVNAHIEEWDFEKQVAAFRERGPWLQAALEHINESHQQVEQLYELDTQAAFGEGAETPQHKAFVTGRLAFASAALRDFWYTAYLRSESLPPNPERPKDSIPALKPPPAPKK